MEITPELSAISVLVIGFILGLQHAIEADHLAAVSTIVTEKDNLWSASLVGGLWGLGHTISLFIVGVVVIFLKLQISETLEARLEAAVGVMLILLGINALISAIRKRPHIHTHSHGGIKHVHFHTHSQNESTHTHHSLSPRSIIVGMVHGLAGSAALMLLVLPVITSPLLAIAYILVFGAGSIGGMMAMSFLFGLPIYLTAKYFSLMNTIIRLLAGAFSLSLGVFIFYEKILS